MPFIGRVRKPKPPREGCQTPRWTYFIPADTLWKCPVCGTVYRLDKNEWAMDCITVTWVKHAKED